MKPLLALPLAVSLIACDQPKFDDKVEALMADPARLEEVRRLCREGQLEVDIGTCIAANEATLLLCVRLADTLVDLRSIPPTFDGPLEEDGQP